MAAGEDGPSGPSPDVAPDAGGEVPELRPAARRRATYVLTRALFLRLLGAIYLVAFLSLARQVIPLLGAHGILPAARFLEQMASARGSRWDAFLAWPTLFWLGCPDGLLQALAWVGVALGGAVMLGVGNALVMALLWALYLSFCHVGQIFYGFGWDSRAVFVSARISR